MLDIWWKEQAGREKNDAWGVIFQRNSAGTAASCRPGKEAGGRESEGGSSTGTDGSRQESAAQAGDLGDSGLGSPQTVKIDRFLRNICSPTPPQPYPSNIENA